MLKHSLDVEFNRLVNQLHGLVIGLGSRDTAGKIRNVRAVAGPCFLDQSDISAHLFSPACFKIDVAGRIDEVNLIDFSVFGSRSIDG